MKSFTRRKFLKYSGLGITSIGFSSLISGFGKILKNNQPNILFCIADDWGWPHSGCYGDQVVHTPNFERLVNEGVIFDHAFVSSPSCTPSRNSILTGQHFWRLGQGANLNSTLDINIPVFPLILEKAGYFIGHWGKCFGPGKLEPGGYINKNPGGPEFNGFEDFLNQRPKNRPFFFWLGSKDPHRPYEKGSGKASGMDLNKISVPGFLPDSEEVRSDFSDYYFEVQRFDRDCGQAIKLLEQNGELDNTIIVMTGDNGTPFPRCKSNIYDMGVHVPLAVRWGKNIKKNRKIKDFVLLADFAPTFLSAAGIKIPEEMTGRTLIPLLNSENEGWISDDRKFTIFGKERHVPAQLAPSMDGYPCRAIRTEKYLYIYNFKENRWPAGVSEGSTHPREGFADCDSGPTKQFIIDHGNDIKYKKYFDWCFAKRPKEELFDLTKDSDQLNNIAGDPLYEPIRSELHDQLINELKATGDPRVVGNGDKFDQYPYYAGYKLRTTQ